MRAASFAGLDQPLEMGALGSMQPGPGEVLLRVRHCGVCGSDIHMATEALFNVAPGTVLGHEFSGEVTALGAGVGTLAVGDRVAVLPVGSCGKCSACLRGEPAYCPDKRLVTGGFADHAIVNVAQCFALPEGLSTELGALAEPLAVALHGLAKIEMAPGARVLVIGAGPIGLLVAYWARRMGAAKLAVSASSARKKELAADLGVDAFLTSAELNEKSLADVLGGPPDVVFECAGKPGLIDLAISLLRRGGTVGGLGLITEPDSFDALQALRKEIRIQMAGFFTAGEFRAALATLAQDGERIARIITSRVTLDELPGAFEELKAYNKHCKVMVATG